MNLEPITKLEKARQNRIRMSNKEIYHFTFDESLQVDTLHLFEVSEQMLEKLKVGDVFVVRGQENDDAVICSSDSTYSLRLVENSNTCLLIPPVSDVPLQHNQIISQDSSLSHDPEYNRKITAIVSCHHDLIETSPKLERLSTLLMEAPLTEAHDRILLEHYLVSRGLTQPSGLQEEVESFLTDVFHRDTKTETQPHFTPTSVENTKKRPHIETSDPKSPQVPALRGYTLDSLRSMVQCSENQLREALRLLPAICLNGLYTGISPTLVESGSISILDIIASSGQDLEENRAERKNRDNDFECEASISKDGLRCEISAREMIRTLCEIDRVLSPPVAAALLSMYIFPQDIQSQQTTIQGVSHQIYDPFSPFCPQISDCVSQKAEIEIHSDSSPTMERISTDGYKAKLREMTQFVFAPGACLPISMSLCTRSLALVVARFLLRTGNSIAVPSFVSSIAQFLPSEVLEKNMKPTKLPKTNNLASNEIRKVKGIDIYPFTPSPRTSFFKFWSSALPSSWVLKWSKRVMSGDVLSDQGQEQASEQSLLFSQLEKFLEGVAVLVPLTATQQATLRSNSSHLYQTQDKIDDRGYVLVEESGLPGDSSLRLHVLLDLKPRWKKEELAPYINPLSRFGVTLEQLLLKETRSIKQPDGVYHMLR